MIEKVNKNKFGVIEYLIEDMEDLKNLPKKDTDNTSYAIMRKGNEKLIYLYSSSAKEWVLINEDLSSIKSSLEYMASDIEELKQGNIEIDLSSYAKKSDLEVKADKSYVDSAIESVDVSSQLTNYATKTELGNKVDKIDGKGLSTNDYTTAEKNKLSGLSNYTHPNTHSASMITEDSTHRFVTDTEKANWDNKSNFDGNYNSLTNIPTIPNKTSQLTNDSGYLTSIPNEYVTETELDNKGYLTEHQDISGKLDKTHNTSSDSHSDIRLLIDGLTSRLNSLADSDDTTLDQLSEIVDYIKNNKSLIDNVTTSKVNISDIIDNLTTNVTNKPLSAKQGVQLKTLIDALTTELNTKANKSDLHSHTNKSVLDGITTSKITEWNNKSTFDGNYNSLTNKPTIPTKTSQLTNDNGFITSIPNEYITESELNAQISSINEDISNKVSHSQFSQLTSIVENHENQINEKQPKGEYALISQLESEIDAREQAIQDINTKLSQQHILVAEGSTLDEALIWLETNGDKTSAYIMPDGFIYAYMTTSEVSSGVTYTNVLPEAIDTDSSIFNGIGYKSSSRLSSSGSVSSSTAEMCASGFIPVKVNDVVRIKNIKGVSNVLSYMISYNSSKTKVNHQTFLQADGTNDFLSNNWTTVDEEGVITITLTSALFGADFSFIRLSGKMSGDTIITVNEEIKEGGGIVIVEKWANTGHSFIPTDYSDEVAELVKITDTHTREINDLKKGINSTPTDSLTYIREWDVPIYDGNIPTFQLTTEKNAITSSENTPTAIYSKYDSLMAKYPKYITKTDLGLCSDGINHVYRYDFKEPETRHQSNMAFSETKIKAILVSGIHFEWAGIHAMYNALEEIASNPSLRDLKRNTHFIVVPCINPYCTISSNYNTSMGVLNANGVQIHRNFEVGFIYPGESGYQELGTRNHGGTAPLSEVETQYIDNIMKVNTDSAFFLTCHNFDTDVTWGIDFIWPSTATKYMCNMGTRLIRRMSDTWLDKYGDVLRQGIAEYKTTEVYDDTILGHAHVSSTDGTETRQATKYGIQGANVEISGAFVTHGTKTSPEASLSSFTMSRGAEVYINFLLMACGLYDYKDKKEYFQE